MVRLENVLKISLQDVLKMSWRRLEEVLKTFWRRLEDVLKTSWRRLEDVLKTSWRRLEDIWPRRIYWSWPRRLEDVFWRRKAKTNIFVLIQTSWRHLLKTKTKEVFKTSSSRRMFAGEVTIYFKEIISMIFMKRKTKLSINKPTSCCPKRAPKLAFALKFLKLLDWIGFLYKKICYIHLALFNM